MGKLAIGFWLLTLTACSGESEHDLSRDADQSDQAVIDFNGTQIAYREPTEWLNSDAVFGNLGLERGINKLADGSYTFAVETFGYSVADDVSAEDQCTATAITEALGEFALYIDSNIATSESVEQNGQAVMRSEQSSQMTIQLQGLSGEIKPVLVEMRESYSETVDRSGVVRDLSASSIVTLAVNKQNVCLIETELVGASGEAVKVDCDVEKVVSAVDIGETVEQSSGSLSVSRLDVKIDQPGVCQVLFALSSVP